MWTEIEPYFREEKLPHIWCPGCGNGIVMSCLARAIDKMGLDGDKTVIVSGIGCSSRASGYLNFNTLHTTHGRALAFATGIKMVNPELNVFVLMGDGDSTAIGGNHFIHAARRNIDLNAIIFNNNIYGMTGGQYSPLTPVGSKATTAPYGSIERPFDIAKLAQAAGATYIARATTYHTKQLSNLIAKSAQNKGFSVVEAMTQCPVSFGRKNKRGDAAEMMLWYKEHAVSAARAATMTPEEMRDKFTIGELYNEPMPEYTAEYQKIIDQARERRA